MHCLCDKLCCEQLHLFPLGSRAEGFITLRAILVSLLSVRMQSPIGNNISQAFFYLDLLVLFLCVCRFD